jgi:hypothetical protein
MLAIVPLLASYKVKNGWPLPVLRVGGKKLLNLAGSGHNAPKDGKGHYPSKVKKRLKGSFPRPILWRIASGGGA